MKRLNDLLALVVVVLALNLAHLVALEWGWNGAGVAVALTVVGWLELRIYRNFNGPLHLED